MSKHGLSGRFAAVALLPALLAPGMLTAGPVAAPSPAQIWYAEQFTLHSAITGRDYLIQVAKPDLKPGVKAPAVYQMDGNTSFGVAAAIVGPDGALGVTEPAFVVGVGYPVSTMTDWLRLRQGDLTPIPIKAVDTANPAFPTGGAEKFRRFLVEELRPRIEASYAVDPRRAVLSGQSYGGLFAAYVLLNQPGDFDGYIIGSPSIWADRPLLEAARTFVAPKPLRVFIGVGAEEGQLGPDYPMVDDAQALAQSLATHNPDMSLKLWVVPDETHYTVMPALYARALRFVLPPPAKGDADK